ncbi:SAM-dependent methyltransferase [Candidatus Gottesmanbacteria bacterium RBG_16_43_7]|uniref:SAM-dependent methyltransferase n=1 Tax=Candidatus Gottesmanbacteria bacterium RBG_16_43_7 TaxID=1798373 RepID=A0A1F5ZAZ3_9BACT|nr:MAG: SAM-dependent methyltransferase [Candidatus Gottesmanbacteria bacterium RBG_16_43_7]
MGKLRNFVTPLHKKTKRDYVARMMDEKIKCMIVAKRYGKEYWDGDRRYGYGGYRYIPGYWKSVAQKLIKTYKLTNSPKTKILDVGCGKAFLLYEINLLIPKAKIVGFDISKYGIAHAQKDIRNRLFIHRAQDKYPYKNKEFDLVISITTLHNLKAPDLSKALSEIERVGKYKYVVIESYRDEAELFNLECWALTCESFSRPDEWQWTFKSSGYTGDYEFIYFD